MKWTPPERRPLVGVRRSISSHVRRLFRRRVLIDRAVNIRRGIAEAADVWFYRARCGDDHGFVIVVDSAGSSRSFDIRDAFSEALKAIGKEIHR
mgnify:CR=1 FL=1